VPEAKNHAPGATILRTVASIPKTLIVPTTWLCAALLCAGCGDGNINLGAGGTAGGSSTGGGSATGGNSPTTAATPSGDTSSGTFLLTSPDGVASTQVNVLSGASSTQSASNGSDFSFEAVMPATSLSAGQRSLSECFSSSAAAPWVFMNATQSNAQTVVIDQNAAQGWAAGGSCQSCIQAAFGNTFGVTTFNLPAGNFCLAAWNTGQQANSIAAKLRPLADYNFSGYTYNGTALNVVFAVAAKQSASWAFNLRAGTHMILEGANSGGGKTYLVTSANINGFQASNGGQNGGFTYLIDSGGNSICGTGPNSTEMTPNNCDNLDVLLPAGTYYYAVVNPTSLPVSFVAFALEYVP